MPFVPQLRRLVRRWLRVAVPAVALAVIALAQPTGPSVAQTAGGPATAPARAVAPGAPITLNFKDADIDSVVGAFGHLLNRTFVIDPRVRGKITLETPRAVPASVAYELLQSALRVQGFAVVETGSISRVVPEADAKLQAGPVTAGRANAGGGDQVVTQIFRLTYESASNLVPVLRPLISPNNTIVAYPNNNSLVITDYAANLQRLQRIIATLDSPASGEVEVVAMKHALATDVALQVSRLLDDQARAGGAQGATVDPGQRVTVLADTRINSILVRSASPTLVATSQTSTPGGGGTFGQSVPLVAETELVRSGTTRTIPAIREDAAFRTNLVLANGGTAAVDVDVALVAETGATLGSRRFALLPLGMTQVSHVVRELGVSASVSGARLVLSTPTSGGAFTAYASVIDARTNDPRTLLPR